LGSVESGIAPPAEAIGKTASEVFPEPTAKILSENDRFALKTGRPLHEEKHLNRNDGIEVLISVTKIPLRDKAGKIIGLLDTSRDITQFNQILKSSQKENEVLRERLENLKAKFGEGKTESLEKKRLLNKILKSARNAFFLINAKTLKIIDCSPSAAKVFGYSRKEMLNRPVNFLHVNAAHLREFRKHLYSSLEQSGYLFLSRFEMKRKDSSIFPTEHTVFPIEDKRGRIVEWVSIVRDQTEYRWTENALKESKERYQMLVETMTDALGIIDENGKIVFVNDKAVNMIGYSREELLGRSPLELLDESNQEIFTVNQKNRRRGERRSYELTWTRKDGRRIPTIISPRDMYDNSGDYKGTFAVITDTTVLKQAEKALIESELKYRSLVDSTDDYIYIVDSHCVYRFTNPKFLSRRNLRGEKIVGRSYSEFHDEDETRKFKDLIGKVYKTGRSLIHEHRSRRDGRYYLRTISPIRDENGKIQLATVVSKDITDLKKTENKLKKQTKELKIKSRNLEEINITLKVLLQKKRDDRKEFEEQVVANVKQLLEPTLKKLRKSRLDATQAALVDILESNIEKIFSTFTSTLSAKNYRFTPTEIQIAGFVREGKATKEIAELLNLSPKTIETYRRNIRKKLRLNRKRINLRSYLLSIQG